MPVNGKTSARGYGWRHQKLRERWSRVVASGSGRNQGGTRASARDGGYPVAASTTRLAPNDLMRRLDSAFDGDGHPLDAAEQSGRPQPPILGGFLAVMPEAADSSSRMRPQ